MLGSAPVFFVFRTFEVPCLAAGALTRSGAFSKFKDALDRKGLKSPPRSHRGPLVDVVDVDYCDDAVVLVVSSSSSLVDKCVDVVYVACCVFSSDGLSLNFDNNKTNVMTRFVGRGIVAARREWFPRQMR